MNETGSQVVGYKGNADQGYGADGIPYAGDANAAFQNFNNIFSSAATRNFEWNTLKYQQQVKDRDTLLGYLQQSQAAVDMPMDEKDRKVLNDQYNNIKELLIAHPNITAESNYEAMTKMLAAKNDLIGKASMAKVRYKAFTDQRTDIANETNPIVRQRRLDHFNEQYNTDIYHAPDPFMKAVDFDENALFPAPKQEILSEKMINDNGIWKKQTTTRSNIKGMLDHYNPTNMLHADMADQVGAFYDFAATDPTVQSDAYLAHANELLDNANKENKFTPGDGYYLEPIAVQDQSTGHYKPVGNKTDFAKKMYVVKSYKTTTNTPVYDEATQKAYKLKAETDKDIAGAKNELAQANEKNTEAYVKKAMLPYDQDAMKALAEQRRKAGNKDEYEMVKEEAQVAKPVADVVQAWTAIDNMQGYKSGKDYLAGLQSTMNPATIDNLKSTYGITDQSKVVEVPLTNSVAKKMVSTGVQNDKGHTLNSKPVKMFAIKNGETGDDISLVGIDAYGNVTSANFSDGINNMIAATNNFVGKGDVAQQSAALRYINRVQGADYGDVSYERIKNSLSKGPISSAPVVTKVKTSSSGTSPATTLPATEQKVAPAEIKPSAEMPIKGANIKRMDGAIKVFYKGKWKKVISKDAATGKLYIE